MSEMEKLIGTFDKGTTVAQALDMMVEAFIADEIENMLDEGVSREMCADIVRSRFRPYFKKWHRENLARITRRLHDAPLSS